jgi:uncharacterized SAM-binding protein YcdF (DUF218 family)
MQIPFKNNILKYKYRIFVLSLFVFLLISVFIFRPVIYGIFINYLEYENPVPSLEQLDVVLTFGYSIHRIQKTKEILDTLRWNKWYISIGEQPGKLSAIKKEIKQMLVGVDSNKIHLDSAAQSTLQEILLLKSYHGKSILLVSDAFQMRRIKNYSQAYFTKGTKLYYSFVPGNTYPRYIKGWNSLFYWTLIFREILKSILGTVYIFIIR